MTGRDHTSWNTQGSMDTAASEIERFVAVKLRPNIETMLQMVTGRGAFFFEFYSFTEMRHCESLKYVYMPDEIAAEKAKIILPELKEMLDIYIPSEIVLVVIQVKVSARRDKGNAVALEIFTRQDITQGPKLAFEPFVNKEYCVAEHCTASSDKLQICNVCRDARYCSRECQVSDYTARHRQECAEIKQIKTSIQSHAQELGFGNIEYLAGEHKGTVKHVL